MSRRKVQAGKVLTRPVWHSQKSWWRAGGVRTEYNVISTSSWVWTYVVTR